VSFVDAVHGWVVGQEGTILATSDGGKTWSTERSGYHFTLSDVVFSDARHGWAVIQHSALLATRDGGHTWSVVAPAAGQDIFVDVAAVGPSAK
jgi:photosystem II stability/assembly factor-like uncharacterized protein